MFTAWTRHVKSPEEKEQFEKSIYNSRSVLERLKKILEDDVKALEYSEMDIKTFDLPNWEYRQAYKNGCRKAYSTIIKLIDLDQQKDPKND